MNGSVIKSLCALWLALLLTGCGDQTQLHSGLSENDANDVVAELSRFKIEAEKQVSKEGVSVSVARGDIERAVNILNAAGLPHQARTNLGAVFQKSGVISSPLEERARYIYALSQEVEATLSQIDGVVVARVHVVLPERIAPGEPVQPASASVFIKYHENLDPDSIEPRIRRLVATSIPGLGGRDDRDLAIVFVPAKAWQDRVEMVQLGPFQLTPERYGMVKIVATCFGVLLLLLVANAFIRQALNRKRQAAEAK
ncbi:MAG: EscJ/YscJ/HrcJ family type secretion inner rane ring protein [Kosakonia cowanii]|jgi:type III secretion protein J|uniref:Lipoprotein n=1 Tax=Kosakonia cowanii JCM 10956 = DSM 18146 TaxID=1300165 RepID=A0A830ZAD4_9ENTR|nr:type III secretion inner membrane ring lipoprotein SctJ [Kosakonia cowanii]APZ07692.1 EscJ/YscJ/HrcJ family type III secretion inner membrane ring protein [Kosakonia cowanii JCM 10956 = DSM 18146]MDF2623101.1 EscJ/YscJ/HrcJ family type secretion inner rane ring protein [Kosakonia cowanii]MDM9618085.1 type III secretion inner membrane ring lipoprotein SctJ [Kosakonia cowanii]MDP4563116.1 type III secretion inner membrane ring lipoprotein SctJ [Kosakonia cowanii]